MCTNYYISHTKQVLNQVYNKFVQFQFLTQDVLYFVVHEQIDSGKEAVLVYRILETNC